jgi:hypothetical protein
MERAEAEIDFAREGRGMVVVWTVDGDAAPLPALVVGGRGTRNLNVTGRPNAVRHLDPAIEQRQPRILDAIHLLPRPGNVDRYGQALEMHAILADAISRPGDITFRALAAIDEHDVIAVGDDAAIEDIARFSREIGDRLEDRVGEVPGELNGLLTLQGTWVLDSRPDVAVDSIIVGAAQAHWAT